MSDYSKGVKRENELGSAVIFLQDNMENYRNNRKVYDAMQVVYNQLNDELLELYDTLNGIELDLFHGEDNSITDHKSMCRDVVSDDEDTDCF